MATKRLQVIGLKGPQGNTGVGISSITVEESTENSGKSEIVFTLTDGTKESIPVKMATEEQLKQIDTNKKEIENLWDTINYVKIAISSFTNNVNTAEMGAVINDVILTWATNKNPKEADIDGTPVADGRLELTGLNLTSNKTWKLTVKDEKDATDSKTTGVTFLNGAYYGAGNAGSITNDFILGLTRVLTSTKARTINVTANEGQFIYYAVPSRLGKCSFNVGGFDGGFELADTIQFTNASGYTEEYLVYKSSNANLGATTVKVS